MIPLADDVPVRRFPWVNTGLILANFAVFLLSELPEPERCDGLVVLPVRRPRTPATPPSRGASPG
jgi:membrane associated rhomboid family serine protease